jgi:hypothetical protein
MIRHPLTWALWAAAITGALLYAVGAWQAMDVALNWAPAKLDSDQLRREIRAESAALLGRWSLGCLMVAAMLGLVGVTLVWPRLIPGAMCGTGVLQAMGINGSRAMIFWGATLITLYGWQVLDRLNHAFPLGVMTRPCARAMIVAAPFLALAFFYSWQALMRIDTAPPVSCCAAVYDRVLDDISGNGNPAGFVPTLLWSSLAGTLALMTMALRKLRFPQRGSGTLPSVIAVGWTLASAVAVKQVWSAYYYQVLSHPCPWCLFLPDYDGAGFLIFGSMAMVIVEAMAIGLADRARRHHAVLAEPAARRIRHSAWRIVAALMAFTALTAGPAILWRIRSGVWLGVAS